MSLRPAALSCRRHEWKTVANIEHGGPLLSCSPYPEDWRAIARLGQAPIWTLQRLDGKPPKLVNFRRLSRSDKKRWLAKAQTRPDPLSHTV